MSKYTVGLVAQVVGLLESTPKPLLIPARTYYPKEAAEKFYNATRPQFKELTPLWHAKENTEIVKKFKYNKLLQGMAYYPDEPKNIAAWKEYMLQDYHFLTQLYIFREKRLKSIYKTDSGSYAGEVAGLSKLKSYIDNDFIRMLIDLGVDKRIGSIKPHKATTDYIDWLFKHADYDSYYELNLVQAPCTYGWSVSAQEIYNHSSFKKEGLFYHQFVLPSVTDYVEYEVSEPNSDGVMITKIVKEPRIGGFSGTARRVCEFTDVRIKPTDYDVRKAATVLGEGIQLETGMMEAAFEIVESEL